MLEMTYSWFEWEEEERSRGYRDGFMIGNIMGEVKVLKKILRREQQYQRLLAQGKEVPRVLEGMHETYVQTIESEEDREVLKFIQKYPRYSREQLAKRILRESEFWR